MWYCKAFSRKFSNSPVCDKCFDYGQLKHDIATHGEEIIISQTNEKQPSKLKCEECGKLFASKSSLNKHKIIHVGIKEFQCEEGGRSFLCKSNMERHEKVVHKGIKPYHMCQECGKWFSTKSNLVKHVKIVHIGMTFKCEECGESFKSTYLRTQHENSVQKISRIFNVRNVGRFLAPKRVLNITKPFTSV